MGDHRSKSDVKSSCDPITTIGNLGLNTSLTFDGDHVANPCGLIAKSYFNDTF